MAGAGFKTFGVGDVLTASDVNTYLMQQAVMNFASSGARGSAIGTAVLAEGMVSYLADTDTVEVYDGSAWVGLGGGFTASTAITATDASWSVPTLADPIVRVTVVGGGGAGGGAGSLFSGAGAATNTVFASGEAIEVTALAGGDGRAGNSSVTSVGRDGLDYGAAGMAAVRNAGTGGTDGMDGQVVVAYVDMTGYSTIAVTIGAGGTPASQTTNGGSGQAGVVIFEYRAV